MELKQIKTYTFEELNDSVKENVLNNFRENQLNDDWYEWLIEDFFSEVKEKYDLDFEQKDLTFDFYSRETNISLNDSIVSKELCSKFEILYDIDLPKKFGVYANYLGGGLCSGLNRSEINYDICEFEEREEDEIKIKDLYKQKEYKEECKKINDSVYEILDYLHEKLNKLLHNLKEEYDYKLSDENIIENIKLNDYSFMENGDLV